MESEEFCDFAKATAEYITKYVDTLRDREVLPSVEPGYLSKLLPGEAPQEPESWQEVLEDVEKFIMPGITHWNSPNFHAYFPCGISYPSMVGELLCAGINVIGFSWMSSPACTELEVIMMNWLGKALGLPKEFLNSSEGRGGGVIQGSASEATLVGLLAAKERTICRIKGLNPDWDEGIIRSKLVAYTSDQSNSSVEKAGLLASVQMRLLPGDEECRLRGQTLLKAVQEDEDAGLIPCFVVACLGTTGTCAFDPLEELGPICKEKNMWLHVDAAYGGAAFVCPEYRHLMAGIEFVDSFNFNPHKWMLVNYDCSAMWVKDSRYIIDAFNVDRIYLAHDAQGEAPDYRHWQIPLGRRFRSLKLWFTLRLYGIEGIQNHIRKAIRLRKRFEQYVRVDDRFEIVTEPTMGLVCFRLKGENHLTKELLDCLMSRKQIYVIAATYQQKLIVRFVVCSAQTEERDIDFAWEEISGQASEVLHAKLQVNNGSEDIREQRNLMVKDTGEISSKLEDLNIKDSIINSLTKIRQ